MRKKCAHMSRLLALLLCASACSSEVSFIEVPLGKYTRHRGYLSQGADLVNGTMTISRATALCDALPECSGITFAADIDKLPKDGSRKEFMAHVWLKGFDEWVPFKGHVTLLKQLRVCEHLKFVKYQVATAGPYCCEGKGCPPVADYSSAEVHCRLPASTPFGMPLCTNLRGDPLQNVARLGKATASSEYPYAENAGPGAAIDGSATNNKMFHSLCDNGPHYWRVAFAEPMVSVLTEMAKR
uniref:Uncharacterized protein n=1 Tax=Haptolina brevifila TaxID=156173 RepID=A0A7S2NDG1_9EUKA